MLNHPTHERLIELGLTGMAKAFEEQRRSPDLEALPFEDRIGLLVDREAAERDTRRLTTRLKIAALRQTACVEDVDLRTPRGIDRAVFAKLVEGRWIDRHENLLVTGATGLGKSWLACALGHKACRDNRSVLYHRVPRLFEALALARGDGRYARLLKSLGRAQLLGTPRSARNPRGPPWPRIHHRHKSAPRGHLAWSHWGPHGRRRHSRSPRPQRPPPPAHRRKHAKTQRQNHHP